jgi:hypothetical protein
MDGPRRRRCPLAGGTEVSRLAGVLAAVWDFVVGDDWVTAIGVALAIALTALIASADAPAWWVMPVAVAALLAASLRRW